MNTYNALEEMNERAVLRKMRQRKNHKFWIVRDKV
jgi:hypothetical protein